MGNLEVLTLSGLVRLPEVIKTALEIEGFRKTEAGTSELPGDRFEQWFAEDDVSAKPKKTRVAKLLAEPKLQEAAP